MDVAIAGMSETGYRQTILVLQLPRELKEVFETPSGDDDVLVQFREAGVAQRVGEFAPDLPYLFAFVAAEALFDEQRFLLSDDRLQLADFRSHGALLAIQLDYEMGAAALQTGTASSVIGRR